MSGLTHNVLKSINYNQITNRRENNFKILPQYLNDINLLEIIILEVPYMYPLLLSNAEQLRKRLQERRIFYICFMA